MYKVLKRDGKITDFNLSKISDAIKMAFEAQERQFHPSVIDFLALKVSGNLECQKVDHAGMELSFLRLERHLDCVRNLAEIKVCNLAVSF